MNVKELIQILQSHNPEREVVLGLEDGVYTLTEDMIGLFDPSEDMGVLSPLEFTTLYN